MDSLKIIHKENLEYICEVDCICGVLTDDVICNVLEKMRKKLKKRVVFSKDSKEHDGLERYTETYLKIVEDYFNKKIIDTKDVLNLKDMDLEKMYFICKELQSLMYRLQKNKSSMILPRGGSHLKVVEGHSVAIVSLYRLVYDAITELLYT